MTAATARHGAAGTRRLDRTRAPLVALAFAATPALAWSLAAGRVPPYILPAPADGGKAALAFSARPGSFRAPGRDARAHRRVDRDRVRAGRACGAAGALRRMVRARDPPATLALPQRVLGHRLDAAGRDLARRVQRDQVFTITIVSLPFALVNLREGPISAGPRTAGNGPQLRPQPAAPLAAIVVPALLPFGAATLRIMFGVAWKVALTAELFGGSRGLGYMINIARSRITIPRPSSR
ncbi:MAG: hypothetical protein IPI73_30900 [Betaproteobacteria bacterium]|nr:hypothetical protein [Betaproteobacteria bacterium]